MRTLLTVCLLFTTTISFSQTDPLMDMVNKIEKKEKDSDPLMDEVRKIEKKEKKDIELSVKNLTKTLSDPKLSADTRTNILAFVKDSDIEVYKAFVAQETKKAKDFEKEKKAIVDMMSNDDVSLSDCVMSNDRQTITCNDRVYKYDPNVNQLSRALKPKADIAPSGTSPREAPTTRRH